ncbi:MAG: T9SS type A sorting domain-containing protein [Bacteroidetes bacterium]|nr:T9SS type A sorting domain-containing protein [Bacteroidota bacterium]
MNDDLIYQFTSDQEKEYSYSIYNSIGELVLHSALGKVTRQFTDQIDMSNLISGIYIFKLNSTDISTTSKVIKK